MAGRVKAQSRTLEGVEPEKAEQAAAAEAADDQTLRGGDPVRCDPPSNRQPWPDLCVTLFNEVTGASLRPKNFAVQFRVDGETSDRISVSSDHGRYTIPGDQIQRLIGKPAWTEEIERVFAEIELAEPCDIDFARYRSSPVRFELTRGSDCGCIPIPLLSVDETCTLRFRAFDCRFVDYLENGEALLDNVGVTVTPVRMAAQSGQPATQVRSQALRTTTVSGLAEITGLQRHQLYSIEMLAPKGYLSETPGPRYRYIGCETFVEVVERLCPCGQTTARTAAFVHEECVGRRFKKLHFEANGRPVCTDDHGVWNVPSDIGDPLTLTSPTMVFQPSTIAMADAPVVFAVAVGEKTQRQLANTVKVRCVDENDHPFTGRTLHVELADGREQTVIVDGDGFVRVPPGSKVYALSDEHGSATTAVLVG